VDGSFRRLKTWFEGGVGVKRRIKCRLCAPHYLRLPTDETRTTVKTGIPSRVHLGQLIRIALSIHELIWDILLKPSY
jgi:hypothetical protein